MAATSASGAAFVTGGSGFVGRSLIHALVERGTPVTALARSDAAAAACIAAGATTVVRCEIGDTAALTSGMAGCAALYHLAAHVRDWGSDAEAERVNVLGTRSVLAAAAAARVRRAVHVSTDAVLSAGDPIINASEDTPIPWGRHPGQYGRTKARAEAGVQAAVKGGLHVVTLRPRWVWGADDTTLLPLIAGLCAAKKWCWVDGGRALTSTCHVRNLTEGMLLAASADVPPGSVFALTDGPPRPVRAVVSDLVAACSGVAEGGDIPLWVARAVAVFVKPALLSAAATHH